MINYLIEEEIEIINSCDKFDKEYLVVDFNWFS